MRRAILLAACAVVAAALPQDDRGLAGRLEQLERGLASFSYIRSAPSSTSEALQALIQSGHGQVNRWFKDLVPLVECDGLRACSADALGIITHKSDLWTIPGMDDVVSLIRGNSTFAAAVSCGDEPSAAAFQRSLEALPAAPRIAVVSGGSPPRRKQGSPWLTLSPRAAEALGRVMSLLKAPIAALESHGNLSLALEIDVDDAWFVPGSSVIGIHLVGQGRIIINPRVAAQLNANAASAPGISPSLNHLFLSPPISAPPTLSHPTQ